MLLELISHVEYQRWLQKLSDLPWRSIVYVGASSFVVATISSNLASFQLMPDQMAINSDLKSYSDTGSPLGSLIKPTLGEPELKTVYDRNIFNSAGELGDLDPLSGDEGGGEVAQKTDLPVRLTGIIYGGSPYNGLATIENTQLNKINSFIVGETLVKDAVISEIHQTRVYLMRGNRKEYLELELKDVIRSARLRKSRSSSMASSGEGGLSASATKFREDGFEREGDEMVMSSEYKQRMILGDLPKVLQDAKAIPNIVDGQIKGFKLERIRDGSIWQKAGFQNGDIVEEINGVFLNNPGNAIKLLNQVKNESQVETAVSRGGQRVVKKLTIR